MQTVKVKVDELLVKVKANRKAHRDVFLRASEGYRAAAVAELDKMLEDAKSGKRVRRYLELVEPMDQTKEYDSVISMLELTCDEVVELTSQEFSQYVLDDWSWKDQFTISNSQYIG